MSHQRFFLKWWNLYKVCINSLAAAVFQFYYFYYRVFALLSSYNFVRLFCHNSSHLPTLIPHNHIFFVRVCICGYLCERSSDFHCWLGGLHLFQVKSFFPPQKKRKRTNNSILCSLLPSFLSLPFPTHLSMKDTVLPQGIVCLAVVPATAIWVQGGKGIHPFELLPSQPACTFFNNFPRRHFLLFLYLFSLFPPFSHSLPP